MTHPVPLLDLAPKRKTPLSLWNPLDYLLLLYWVFFFPQAIRWYVETFGTVMEYKDERDGNWQKFLQVLRNDPIQRNLLTQSIVLICLFGIGVSSSLAYFGGVPISWFGIIILGIGLGFCIAITIMLGVISNISLAVIVGVTISIVLIAATTIMFSIMDITTISLTTLGVLLIAFGIAINAEFGALTNSSGDRFVKVLIGELILLLIFNLIIIIFVSLVSGVGVGILCSILLVSATIAFILHLPDFLLACLPAFIIGSNAPYKTYIVPSRIIWLPLPRLQNWLKVGLQNDPDASIKNISQLLCYSMQFIPIVNAVNSWLAYLPNAEIYKQINSLVNEPHDNKRIIQFSSAILSVTMWHQTISFLPKTWKQKISWFNVSSLRTNTPARAACAGYWLMHTKDTTAAMDAFSHNRHILHGETLYQTARALDLGRKAESLQNVVAWETESNWLNHLSEEPLRPQAIATLRRLRGVAQEASVAAVSYSKLNRSAALGRAISTLTEMLDDIKTTCPELERPMVREIAEKWRDILALAGGKIGQQAITKPVENPFVVGNPVSGAVFVGREEIFQRIEELWGNNAAQSVPSLVLFGHRRMGKTSILQNLGERRFGVNTIVAPFTMQRAGRLKNTGELLGIFAANIHEALAAKGINVNEPDFAAFEQAPYPSFNRFLSEVKRLVTGQRLILTIDEFELIEEAIQKGAVDAELLSYLRGVIHSERWFVLALAGLHTLEEMTADYWNPLFSSVTPVRVSFLTWDATANLLANPYDDFPLDFTREAIDRVYAYANGQPFLTQLIGHTLVRLYNQSVFENLHAREARFSAADVDEVVERAEFYEQGHYYFQGVWSQAQGSYQQNQVALLRGLAFADGSLDADAWQLAAGLETSVAREGIQALLQHDVVMLKDECYDFAVPLMRRWLRKNRE